MHITKRIASNREKAKRLARRPIIQAPVPATTFSASLGTLQEREETLRWLLNCKPSKMHHSPFKW